MLFIINADGTVQTTFPSQVYQGSNAASDIIVVAPWVSGAAITVSFELPNGARTTPSLMTPQDAPVTLDGVEYKAWRALLPYAITQYAGTVTAQFSIYTGTQTTAPPTTTSTTTKTPPTKTVVTSSAATFDVYAGAVPELPDTPDANVYAKILAALGVLDGYYKDIAPRLQEAEADIAAETNAREAADTALGQRVDSVESGLTSEAAARQTADTALGNRIDAVEGDIDGKVDKVQAGSNYKVYGVKPANSGGAQTSIDATEFATKGNTIVMRDQNGIFYVKDPVYDSQPVNLRTQTSAINAAKTEVKGYVDTRFSQFDLVVVVSALPATGEENKLYLLTKENGEAGDLFEEYIWINGAWELQGSASIDLSGYATTAEMESYVADNAFPKLEGVAAGYRLVGIKSNGDPVLYTPNNYSTEPNSIAQRGTGGTLIVGTPTTASHATTKQYVDGKCVTVNCDLSTLSWTKAGQVGPDATKDIAWITPYSALGIKSGAKAVIWVLTNAGYPYKTGSCVFGTYPTTEESGGLIQFTGDGNLTIIGANSPSMSVAPNALFVVFY